MDVKRIMKRWDRNQLARLEDEAQGAERRAVTGAWLAGAGVAAILLLAELRPSPEGWPLAAVGAAAMWAGARRWRRGCREMGLIRGRMK